MTIEQITKIAGYENYRLTSSGKIYKVVEADDQELFVEVKVTFHKSSGYMTFMVRGSDDKQHQLMLHRVLALHFLPNPNNYKVVDHKNRNKLDNSLSNLRWATQSENSRNRSGIGEYINVLPESCVEFKSYNQHKFIDYFINTMSKQIFYKVLNQYRILNTICINGYNGFWLLNDENKQAFVYINQLLLGHYNK